MDGNNRFSIKKNLSSFNAYKIGANKLLSVTKYIFNSTNVNYVSAFALSSNNLNRSKKKINTLKEIFDFFLNKGITNKDRTFNIEFRGNLNFLSDKLLNKIKQVHLQNKKKQRKLIIYVNYSGINDILSSANNLKNKNITLTSFKKNLLSRNDPDPDILIRTGGYSRISNFFLFQISFTELFFKKKLWPEITNTDIDKIIQQYNKIDRKFGI